jgi:septal ring factor EnvC (AmiA/AmiB activator)
MSTESQPTEKKKSDWRDGKHPLSVRVKGPEKIAFMESLLEKGNMQYALDQCITMAMYGGNKNAVEELRQLESTNFAFRQEIQRINVEKQDLEKQVAKLKSELEKKPDSNTQVAELKQLIKSMTDEAKKNLALNVQWSRQKSEFEKEIARLKSELSTIDHRPTNDPPTPAPKKKSWLDHFPFEY